MPGLAQPRLALPRHAKPSRDFPPFSRRPASVKIGRPMKSPCLALPGLSMPRLASPCLARPSRTQPNLARFPPFGRPPPLQRNCSSPMKSPCHARPRRAAPSLAMPSSLLLHPSHCPRSENFLAQKASTGQHPILEAHAGDRFKALCFVPRRPPMPAEYVSQSGRLDAEPLGHLVLSNRFHTSVYILSENIRQEEICILFFLVRRLRGAVAGFNFQMISAALRADWYGWR